jgi:hypothetical protein
MRYLKALFELPKVECGMLKTPPNLALLGTTPFWLEKVLSLLKILQRLFAYCVRQVNKRRLAQQVSAVISSVGGTVSLCS